MDVRIGVTHTAKELGVELADGTDADALAADLEAQISAGTAMVWLTDRRGRRVGVPAAKVAYVELDAKRDEHRVGFGASSK